MREEKKERGAEIRSLCVVQLRQPFPEAGGRERGGLDTGREI